MFRCPDCAGTGFESKDRLVASLYCHTCGGSGAVEFDREQEPTWTCPKCGSHKIIVRHDTDDDELRIKCMTCEHIWREPPLDAKDASE